MKRLNHRLAWILGGAHLAAFLLYFGAYFLSPDSERGMILFIVIFTDPWVLPIYSGFSGSLQDEVTIATAVILFGSSVWWGIGWLLDKITCHFEMKKEPNKSPQPTPPSRGG